MNNQEVRFVYARDNARPVTIAYRFNDETKQIEYNSAACGRRDMFAKKIGRAIASGRLAANVSNKHVAYEYVSGPDAEGNVAPRYNLIAAYLFSVYSEY